MAAGSQTMVSVNSTPASSERRTGQARATRLQTLQLGGVEHCPQRDRDLTPTRGRAVVEVDVDRHLAQIPAMRPGVHHQRGRNTRRDRGRKQLMRRRTAALTTEPQRLIGNQAVLPIDHDLLPERPCDRVCCSCQAHAHSIAARSAPGIGAGRECRIRKSTHSRVAPIGALSADGWRLVLRGRVGHLTTSTDDCASCATRSLTLPSDRNPCIPRLPTTSRSRRGLVRDLHDPARFVSMMVGGSRRSVIRLIRRSPRAGPARRS